MKETGGHGSKFTRKMEAAIVALMTHRNTEEAARAVGIGATTLRRWLKDPEFDGEYRKARRAAFSQSIARLQQASGAAASTLLKIMVDPNAPTACCVRAADHVLDHATRGMEIEDILVRVSELERTHGLSKSPGRLSPTEND